MNMHLLSGGRLRMRRNVYFPDAPKEQTIDLPVSCALLKHAQGNVLFDTGCHPDLPTTAEARWGSLAHLIQPIFQAQDAVVHQLPLAGLGANDIDVVICSHLHPDHCGCNALFPKATVFAQASEMAAAQAGGPAKGYISIEYDLPTPIQQIDGEHDLFGDGRITLLPLPGHTPGVMAAHVTLDHDGAFLLASDAVALRAHLDQRFTPKNTWNHDRALESLDTVARLQRAGATVLFGHDDAQWHSVRKGVAFYA